jgi:DNA-binding HxlR family transcriptional regulator
MSWASDILQALENGPMTNAQLQTATGIRSANISSICNYLIRNGRIRRVDSEKPGRGYPATYATTGKPPPIKSLTRLRATNAGLLEATSRALKILERNLHRQTEKCDDAVTILRKALSDYGDLT